MKLSIIVPAYNSEKYIANCLEDLISQNLNDYEIIVVNDGSTDNTGTILNEYKEKYPGIFKLIQISNGGQGRARNFALREAKGDYIGFVDADDRCSHDMFSVMLDTAYKENADVVVCDFYKVNESGEHYEKAALQDDKLSAAGAVWNKLFRNKIIGGVRFSEGLWYEDLTFSAKLLLKSKKTVFVNKALYYYSFGHVSTMTNDNAKKNLDIIRVMEDIRVFALKEDPEYDMDFLILNHILLETIKRVSVQKSKNRRKVLKTLLNYVRQSIPDLSNSKAYLRESRNRRIIMKLNYCGLYYLSNLILRLNEIKCNNSNL